MVEISPLALSYKSLSNPQICHQILFYIHCTHTQRLREVKHGCMSRRELSLKTLNLNQFSKFKMYKREHKFLGLIPVISFCEEMQRFDTLIYCVY